MDIDELVARIRKTIEDLKAPPWNAQDTEEIRFNVTYGEIIVLLDEIDSLKRELADYDLLAEIQLKRERPWIEAWRKAHDKPSTSPDYGEMLAWIVGRAERAERALQTIKEEADEALDLPRPR